MALARGAAQLTGVGEVTEGPARVAEARLAVVVAQDVQEGDACGEAPPQSR